MSGGIGSALRRYAELARVSNLPTCASNALVGAALAAAGGALDRSRAGAAALAVMLLYVAGMALNDLLDLEVDRRERPQRPLPSGRISTEGAMRFTWICFTLGLGILAIMSLPALLLGLALAVAIIAYDALHRRSAWTVVLMGLCRALVYPVAAAAIVWPLSLEPTLWCAAGLGGYVIALSVVARVEMEQVPLRRFAPALVLPLIALAPALALRPDSWTAPLIAGAALIAWLLIASANLLRRPPRIGPAVGGWIAGICLVDAVYLALLDQPVAALVASACWIATVLGQRFVKGT